MKILFLTFAVPRILVSVSFTLRDISLLLNRSFSSHNRLSSLFDYCHVVYGLRLPASLASCVQLVHNSCLRFSFCARKFDHISPLLKKSGWLPMRQRWILHLCCIIYKTLRDCSPPYLFNLFARHAFHPLSSY